MDNDITERQRVMGTDVADTWIVPPQFTSFVSAMRTSSTDARRVGETVAARLFVDGPDSFTDFRGSKIRVSRVMNVDRQQSIDPLKFEEQIGEMAAFFDENSSMCDIDRYRSCNANMQIFDEDRNRFVTMMYDIALKKTGRFNPDGSIAPYSDNPIKNAFTSEELANDVLHMMGDNGPIAQKYFVNMPDKKLSAASRMMIGKTIMNKLMTGQVVNATNADEILASVKQALRIMESYPRSVADVYMPLILANAGASVLSARADRPASANRPIFDLLEYPTDPSNGFNRINVKIDLANVPGARELPPGFTSFYGIKALVQEYKKLTPADIPTSIFRDTDSKMMENLGKSSSVVQF